MKTIKTTLIVLFAMSFTMAMQAKKVELKYDLKKGLEIIFELSTKQDIVQDIVGTLEEIGTSQILTVKFDVLGITEDGNYRLSKKISRLQGKISSSTGDMEYDSKTIDSQGAIGETLDWLKSTSVEFVLSPTGEIIEITDAETISKAFTEKFSGSGIESQIAMGLASQFGSEDEIKQSIRGLLLSYPETKVKIGKAWESSSQMKLMLIFKSVESTMVNEINGDVASLTQDVKITVGEGGGSMEMEGMEMEYDLTGNKKAAYEVDLKTGLIISGEAVTTISGVVSVDSPQLPAPMSIPMSIKTTITIKRMDK